MRRRDVVIGSPCWATPSDVKKLNYYLGLVVESEFAQVFAAGVFASVEEHAPGATEGEGGAARVGVKSLTDAGALLVEGAASVGGQTVVVEFVDEFAVEVVAVGQRQSFPRHRHDDDPRGGAHVPATVFDQAQHFLLHARAPDDLLIVTIWIC